MQKHICIAELNTVMHSVIPSYLAGYIFSSSGIGQTTSSYINQKYTKTI